MVIQEKILVTGAGGQLGIELCQTLSEKFGAEAVYATDINPNSAQSLNFCNFSTLNVLDKDALRKVIEANNFTQVYHLAAILSAIGEKNPLFTWDLNINSLLSILELAKEFKFKLFWPSSIAVFGKDTPNINTPQNPNMIPETVYGISKQSGEQWCNYYHLKYGVDVRSVRYPGLIGYKTLPGGGTTDYAVDIFYKAIEQENFNCFLQENTRLPMMYMEDAIAATINLMLEDSEKISIRTSYNISGMDFTPKEIYEEILKRYPNFKISYNPDSRQQIAETWPQNIDDSYAQKDWNWKPKFNLQLLAKEMILNLKQKITLTSS